MVKIGTCDCGALTCGQCRKELTKDGDQLKRDLDNIFLQIRVRKGGYERKES